MGQVVYKVLNITSGDFILRVPVLESVVGSYGLKAVCFI